MEFKIIDGKVYKNESVLVDSSVETSSSEISLFIEDCKTQIEYLQKLISEAEVSLEIVLGLEAEIRGKTKK